jgi:hypothetical protein
MSRARAQIRHKAAPMGAKPLHSLAEPQPCQGWGRGFESPRPLQIFVEYQNRNSGPSGPLSLTLVSSSSIVSTL